MAKHIDNVCEANVLTRWWRRGRRFEMKFAGMQTIIWNTADADSMPFTSKVLYSADAGKTWAQIGQGNGDHLQVDFDKLPGANGAAMMSVLVSDAINTGRAASGLFSKVRLKRDLRSHFTLQSRLRDGPVC